MSKAEGPAHEIGKGKLGWGLGVVGLGLIVLVAGYWFSS